jgi:anti-anti-sigma factor
MTTVATPAVTSTRYAGAPSLTIARRSRACTKRSLPGHGRPGRTIVALHGDLDIASTPALRQHLIGTLHHSGRILILDLGEVTFCDAAGLAVLIGTQRRAAALGITVHLANPRPQVAKMLRMTGLDRKLTVRPTVSELLAEPLARTG